jgi:thiamine biosynthesis lipoprotein
MPWYLRRLNPHRIRYAEKLPAGADRVDPNVAIWVLAPGAWEQLDASLREDLAGGRRYQIEHHGLRPSVVLLTFIRRDLWDAFLAPIRAKDRKEASTMGATTGPAQPAAAVHSFSHQSMGCRFEIRIAGVDADEARRAAGAAFEELDRLNRDLSHFNAYGDVGRINAAKVGRPVRIGMEAMDCLLLARRFWEKTNRAFDATAGAAHWAAEEGRRLVVGMQHIEIDAASHAVTKRKDVRLDFGGIGKGFALDRLAELLRDRAITSALLAGGASTVLAMDAPPGETGWRVALRNPADEVAEPLGHVLLAGRALSGSSTFHEAHIIDPSTGRAVPAGRAAWVAAPSGAEADALSTAFCVLSREGAARACRRRKRLCGILPVQESGRWRLLWFGGAVPIATGRHTSLTKGEAR